MVRQVGLESCNGVCDAQRCKSTTLSVITVLSIKTVSDTNYLQATPSTENNQPGL